jgi:hypothetical protein
VADASMCPGYHEKKVTEGLVRDGLPGRRFGPECASVTKRRPNIALAALQVAMVLQTPDQGANVYSVETRYCSSLPSGIS